MLGIAACKWSISCSNRASSTLLKQLIPCTSLPTRQLPSIPDEDIVAPTEDTKVLEQPSEKIEEKVEDKVEDKSDVTPKVDIDDYKESPTNTAKITVSSTPEIDETNVIAKMAAMPYKDRVAFMIEHQDIVDAAMRKESARRERERRKI